jgi:hypothetical protein
MHRGGTSLVAELVSKWGAYAGESDLFQGDQWNPRGYWEYAPLVWFDDRLLQSVDSRWDLPPSDESKSVLAALAEEPVHREQALRLLADMRASGRPWVWKDPRLSVLLPFWEKLWDDVTYVVAVRDPGDIALSLQRRDGFEPGVSWLLWQAYMSRILGNPKVLASSVFVSYERLLKDGLGECRRLCAFLDGRLSVQSAEDDTRTSLMTTAIAPDLWRSRAGATFLERSDATQAQKALYGIIEECAKDLTFAVKAL